MGAANDNSKQREFFVEYEMGLILEMGILYSSEIF